MSGKFWGRTLAACLALLIVSGGVPVQSLIFERAAITASAEEDSAVDSAGIDINEENFPDANFRDYVLQNCDKNSDNTLSADEITAVTSMSVNGKSISSLKGIEYFTSLKFLYCYQNNLTELNLQQNTELQQLMCMNNKLTELDLSKNTKLWSLYCNDNNLTELDLKNNTKLETIDCYNNQFQELNLSKNTSLRALNCSNNKLTTLDLRTNTNLYKLICKDNNLENLVLNKNKKLDTLYCDNNELTELDLSNNPLLSALSIGGNKITELDLSKNEKVTYFKSNNDPLESVTFANNEIPKSFYHTCNEVAVEGKEPTCGEAGYEAYSHCSLCGKEITEKIAIPATGEHTVTAIGEAKEPTCTETGITAGEKCSFCGKVFTAQEELPVKEHTDENNDGYCDNGCGLEMSVYRATIKEVSATLKGDIGMNYYITLPQSVTDDNGAYVQFTVNGEPTKIMVNTISASESDGTYKFTYRMSAKEMHDKVTFAVYDGSGNLVDIYSKTGDKVEGSSFDYSLAEYFNALSLDTSVENEALVNLAKATLAYGSYAQKAFGYDVNTADSVIDISGVTVDTLADHKMTTTGDIPEDLTLSEMTLILKTETALCLYFKADDISNYSFTLDNNAVIPDEIAGEGLYCIKISDISAKDLDTKHTLVINNSCTLIFDALSYAYSVVKAGGNDAVCDAVKALYKYNEAANAYFG